ncbi:YtxH domain-containing protein [Actinomyces sp. B33]|uniref:YtxH domain-containing protein n=1 Tax=Actinomyces sp. B33 TaxID=2942131 RepID=UPI00234011BA|nr:YtxH domain-containing protein [Actinomyces sp. B33]MDC4232429.1 YtxH domain-containing protein [Actinomyces sp. B33]
MGTKFGIALGLAAGYVLGTRAGREQYDRIRSAASRVRRAPLVSQPLDRAGEKVSDIVRIQGEKVTDKVADAVKERLFGAPPNPEVRTRVVSVDEDAPVARPVGDEPPASASPRR